MLPVVPDAARPVDQDEIFASSEGDRWFERNADTLLRVEADSDPIIRAIDRHGIRPRAVLEVGAANGFRLAMIARRTGARTVGVEPAAKAVADGRARYPEVDLRPGLASALPVEGMFDLVVVNFVLHWVGRPRLLAAVAEIDRVLDDGGHLIVGDFLPGHLTRTAYAHLPGAGVETFKQDYAEVFVASGLYERVARVTGAHGVVGPVADAPEHERTAVTVLRKRLRDLYAEVRLPV